MIPYLSGSASPRAKHAGELLDAHVEAVLVVLKQQIGNPLEEVIRPEPCYVAIWLTSRLDCFRKDFPHNWQWYGSPSEPPSIWACTVL